MTDTVPAARLLSWCRCTSVSLLHLLNTDAYCLCCAGWSAPLAGVHCDNLGCDSHGIWLQ